MQVEVQVKVNGQVVRTHQVEVSGTLEQMEETIHALGKKVAGETLQATVETLDVPRPLFQKKAGPGGTRGMPASR